MRYIISTLLFCVLGVSAVEAQSTAKEYPDGHGGKVLFPLGDVSFADEVVSFEIGEPHAKESLSEPAGTLDIPDYNARRDETYLTLGCGGTLTVRFSDNALVDVPGPDLYVFEIGPAVEAMHLWISQDGNDWLDVGEIRGARSDVDIAEHAEAGTVFHYVRVSDLKGDCKAPTPGADVDAIGAIGAAVQFSLNGAVLFDTGQAELKPEAQAELNRLAVEIAEYEGGRVTIEGHTDNVGTPASNQTLSVNRARSVVEYLQARPELAAFTFEARGYGESRPTASNDTEEGRAQNRRVDAVLIVGGA